MDEFLQSLVWQRAGGLCEYCRMPSRLHPLPYQIDHIIAQKHHGFTVESNLALSCVWCNAYNTSTTQSGKPYSSNSEHCNGGALGSREYLKITHAELGGGTLHLDDAAWFFDHRT